MDWLADLYDAHASALYGFVLNLTRSTAESEDILHDLFLKLARDEKRLRPLAAQKSYLFAMAHRAVIDAVRRRQTREHRHEIEAAEKPAVLFQGDPDQQLFASEAAEALAELPLDQRAVVHLKLWEGHTFAEIAAALDIPPNTAASRYRYGLDKCASGCVLFIRSCAMELENDLKMLRLAAPSVGLRARILRDARQPVRSALIPPWFAAIEGHWLYPGRVPAAALALAWLVIASLRFNTPPALFPTPPSTFRINPDEFARLELERSRILAELNSDEPRPSQPSIILPPRS